MAEHKAALTQAAKWIRASCEILVCDNSEDESSHIMIEFIRGGEACHLCWVKGTVELAFQCVKDQKNGAATVCLSKQGEIKQ